MGSVSLCQALRVQSMPRRMRTEVKYNQICKRWSTVGWWFRAYRSPRNFLACHLLPQSGFFSLGGTLKCQKNMFPAFYIDDAGERVAVICDKRRIVSWNRALILEEYIHWFWLVLVINVYMISLSSGAQSQSHRTFRTAIISLKMPWDT